MVNVITDKNKTDKKIVNGNNRNFIIISGQQILTKIVDALPL